MYSRTSARVCNNSCKGFRLRALLLEAGWELAMVEETRNIRREVLPNGLTLITEEMQHIRSVSIGIWIKTGSRDEDLQWNGISHFIEHMVFLGTKNTVKKFEREPVLDFYKQRFAPGNLIICAAGHLQHEQFVDLVRKHFGDMKPMSNGFYSSQPKVVSRIILRNKKALEQVQICVGVPSHPIAHEKRHASYILNTLLGGGMSSRLFQNIRERQCLAYAIYSDLSPYRDTGCLSVYAGTSRESAAKVVRSVVSEFRKLKSDAVSGEELRRAKDQLKGSLMLSLESSTARMSNLARQEMYFDRFYTLDELIEKIESVTAEELQGLANEFFQTDSIAVTVLGNLNGLKLTREHLAC